MKKQIKVQVEDKMYEELAGYCASSGKSIQDFVAEAIGQMLLNLNDYSCFAKDQGYTFSDLFAGIGGMHLAWSAAGAHCVYANEWNRYCQKTYWENFCNFSS